MFLLLRAVRNAFHFFPTWFSCFSGYVGLCALRAHCSEESHTSLQESSSDLCLGRYFGIDSRSMPRTILRYRFPPYASDDTSVSISASSLSQLPPWHAASSAGSLKHLSSKHSVLRKFVSLQTSLQSCRDTHSLPWCEVISGHYEVVTFAPAQGDRPTYMRIHI